MIWILLFLITVSFSSIVEYNLNISNLTSFYDPDLAINKTFQIFTSRSVELSSYAAIAGVAYLADGVTTNIDNNSLIFAWGEIAGPLLSEEVNGVRFNCVEGQYDPIYSWACDFDGDFCTENIIEIFVNRSVETEFNLNNKTFYTNSTSNILNFPQDLLEEISNSSGRDVLNMSSSIEVEFTYMINDRIGGFYCADDYKNYSDTIIHTLNSSFFVGGDKKFIFLSKPIINEQWFRNNKIEVIIFSQFPLSNLTYSRGNYSKSVTFRQLNETYNFYGLKVLVSNNVSKENIAKTSPHLLEKRGLNYSYIYVFEEEFEGLGYFEHYVKVEDILGRSENFSFTTLSRALSYQSNYSEVESNFTRKSSYFEINYSVVYLGLVVLGILLLFFIK